MAKKEVTKPEVTKGETEEPVRWVCSDCGIKRSKPEKRMPMGWKRRKEALYCPECWNKRYILRAITIAVQAPVDKTWDEFGQTLRDMWRLTTAASNWIMTELYMRDDRRIGHEEKISLYKPAYLYPQIRALFPGLPSQTCAAIEKALTAKYRSKRWDVIWTSNASLPTYRYPTPFPVPNQGWSVSMEENHPVVSVRIGDERVSLKLRSGPGYHRQIGQVKQIVSGDAEQGQLDLYRQGKDVMCKMAAWLLRTTPREKDATTLFVHTDPEAMVIALNVKDDKLWTYHGDQIKRWSAEHRDQLQRWADDHKAEHRPIPPFQERRENAAIKYRNRMKSACHELSSMIAGYASRRRFATVRYDDTMKDYCPGFPWFQLSDKIKEKCDALGIEFVKVVPQAEVKAEPDPQKPPA